MSYLAYRCLDGRIMLKVNMKALARMRCMGNVAKMGEKNTQKLLFSQKPRRRWEDNTKMNLREIGWEGVDWIHLAQDRDL